MGNAENTRILVGKIASIRPVGRHAVWDIAVAEDESYIAGGFINHNSSGPNLQNIPRPNEDLPNVRRAFVARPGFVLLDADYSQIELRLMAHYSQDPYMLKVYQDGGDIHKLTAEACGCSRQSAKGINFGLLYCMSPKKLAQVLGVSLAEAERYHHNYFKLYKGVTEFHRLTKIFAKKHGFVNTLLGHRRYLPDINSTDFIKRGMSERQAINTRIQGSAADLIKVAMRNIDREFKARGWFGKDAFIISQVHDELIFEVRADLVEQVTAVVKNKMETAITLRVPLIADPKYGPSWADAK